MTASMLPLFVAVPLVVAGALTILGRRPRVQAVAMFAVLGSALAGAVALVVAFRDGGAWADAVGLWPFGIAIPFAADMFTALMLTFTLFVTIVSVVFAMASGRAASPFFAPLLLVMVAGVSGALLTADLFNMFVFIEVMLLPAYGLFVLAAPGSAPLRQIAGARLYVTVNLLTSTIFLTGVGFVYGTAGTVNLAELAGVAAEDDTVAIAMAICIFALSIKAAAVPVHGWYVRAYPATSPAMTALFSALHAKVAIYAIYRLYAVVFDGEERFLWIGVAVVIAGMVIGGLGALGEKDSRTILAFSTVSQIGYILLGVALFTGAGLAAGIFYLLHHIVVKTSLFLSAGAIEERYGTATIGHVWGITKREPWIAAAFFVAALSLAGIPPFSGFVAKLSLIIAAIDAGQILAVVAMLVVSLITLIAMLRIWNGVFWGRPPDQVLRTHEEKDLPVAGSTPGDGTALVLDTGTKPRIGVALAAPAIVLAVLTIALGLGAELLLGLSATAADGLVDTSAYIEAVTNP